MCEPVTMAMMAVSALGAASSLFMDTPKPPKPQIPAAPAPVTNDPNADIKLGTDQGPDKNNSGNVYDPLEERRSSGNALGNLGRSALSL